MALNIKNPEVERLAAEVARLAGETKTQAIRRALEERRLRLARDATASDSPGRFIRFLENELWPLVPDEEQGRRLSREEEAEILGYGPEGV